MRYGELQFDDNESDTSLYAQDNSAQAEELDQCRARVVELEQQVDQIKKDAEKRPLLLGKLTGCRACACSCRNIRSKAEA
jgi:hypothetical protein